MLQAQVRSPGCGSAADAAAAERLGLAAGVVASALWLNKRRMNGIPRMTQFTFQLNAELSNLATITSLACGNL